MSYTPEEVDDKRTTFEEVNHPTYSIFNSEKDNGELTLLNFSRYRQESVFPDYTAERKYSDNEREVWEVRNGAGKIEAEINKGHVSKDELAYKLQNIYETLK
jgi:hypothetical protein